MMVTAEIVPLKNKISLARHLEEEGFDIIATDDNITVAADLPTFENFFSIRLHKKTKKIYDETSFAKEYYQPDTQPQIPEKFRHLIKEVIFPEPPQFF